MEEKGRARASESKAYRAEDLEVIMLVSVISSI
jgi:hypothetical protein